MRKITFAAVIFALLAGCAGDGRFMRMRSADGGDVTRAPGPYAAPQYRENYPVGATPYFNDKIWPPVWPGQAFPVQEMHSE